MQAFVFATTTILFLSVLRWRSHRKLLELTFRVNVLNSFIPGFEKNALILCGQLGKETENGNIDDVHNALLVCTLNTLLGIY